MSIRVHAYGVFRGAFVNRPVLVKIPKYPAESSGAGAGAGAEGVGGGGEEEGACIVAVARGGSEGAGLSTNLLVAASGDCVFLGTGDHAYSTDCRLKFD